MYIYICLYIRKYIYKNIYTINIYYNCLCSYNYISPNVSNTTHAREKEYRQKI